jgi:peptide/nickel transport system ATP-binding protein
VISTGPRLRPTSGVREIFEAPRESYTRALLAAGLDPDPQVQAATREERQQRLASIGTPALAGS